MRGRGRWGWLGWAVLGLAGGCSGEDAARLQRGCQVTAGKIEELTGGVGGKLAAGMQALRGSWDEAAPETRVAIRLRWDRGLAGSAVEVQAAAPGEVRLVGTVRDGEQRSRAVELARTTQGVERVTDDLRLGGAREE